MRGGVFCLFFCCISALSAHYLFNKPCRGWRPRQPAFWTVHLVIYYTNLEKTHKLWQGRELFARFGRLHKFVTIKKIDTSISGRRVRRPLHKSSTAAKSLRSLRTSPCAEGKYKRCRFSSSIFCLVKEENLFFFFFPLHRLVGLRLLRLCLKLR